MTEKEDYKRMVSRFIEWERLPKEKFSKSWSLWIEEHEYAAGMSAKQFIQGIVKIGDFSDREGFIKIWSDNTDEQGWPIVGRSLSIFQKGIVPAWEHKANLLGGHWVIQIVNFDKAEQVWYTLLMTILCEQLGHQSKEINGIMISPRDRSTMIYVWNRHSLNAKYKELMKSFICETLDVPPHWTRYNTHKYKLNKNKTKKKEHGQPNQKPENSPQDSEPTSEPDQQPNLSDHASEIDHEDSTTQPLENEGPFSPPLETEFRQSSDQPTISNEQPTTNISSDQRSIELDSVEEEEEEEYQPETEEDDEDDEENSESELQEIPSQETLPITNKQPTFFSQHVFTMSIGFLIIIAALYNIYILFYARS